jgi:pimeloyl-ACP methyl ester carboxylesterase
MKRLLLLPLTVLSLLAGTANYAGHKVHYTLTGDAQPALVLVHGWTCDETFWSANVPELAKHYRVLTVDLPGHGQSDPLPAYSMEAFADAVGAAMKDAGVARATLVGHSMGGPVLLAFARLHRDQISAIVGVDAVFLDAATAANLKNFAERFNGPNAAEARAQMVRAMFTPATTPEVRQHIERVMLAASPEVAYLSQKAIWTAEFWRDDVIDLPMIDILAGNDSFVTEAGLRKRFPLASVVTLPDTGHFLMMEKPQDFNRVLLDWLARQK